MFNKKAVAIGILAMTGGASGIAAAEGSQGFYLGGGVGRNTIKDNSIDFNASDTAFKIFGGYDINQYVSIEGTYIDGGSPSQTIEGIDVKAKVSGFDGSVLAGYNFTPQFSMFGRLGVLFWDEKISSAVLAFSSKQTGHDMSYGVGAGFRLNADSQLRLEWQSANTDLDVSVVTLSFAWKFNK